MTITKEGAIATFELEFGHLINRFAIIHTSPKDAPLSGMIPFTIQEYMFLATINTVLLKWDVI